MKPKDWVAIACAVLPILVGGIFWLAAVQSDAAYARRKIDALERVEKRLIRIEVRLGIDEPLRD